MPTLDDIPILVKNTALTGEDTFAVSDNSSSGGSKVVKVPAALVAMGYTHGWKVDTTCSQLAGQTTDVELMDLATNTIIRRVMMVCTEVFAGGSISACTAAVGTTADPDDWVDESNCFTGATVPFLKENTGTAISTGEAFMHSVSSQKLELQIVASSDDVSEATTGIIYVFASLLDTTQLDDVTTTLA